MKKTLGMVFLLIRASVRSRMQYRFNFLFSSLMAALIHVVDFLLVAIVMLKFGHIQGWSIYEVGYLFAVIGLSRAIYRSLASDVHHIQRYLVEGELDALLLRPVPVLLALMTRNFTVMAGEIFQGSAVLVFSMRAMMKSEQIGWEAVPYTLLMVATGAVILFSIGLATASSGFWLTRIEELQNMTEDASRSAAQYPLSLYPVWLKGMLTVVIPVAFVNYLPALFVLRGELGIWILPASAGVAAISLFLALQFWKTGLARYQSTGS